LVAGVAEQKREMEQRRERAGEVEKKNRGSREEEQGNCFEKKKSRGLLPDSFD